MADALNMLQDEYRPLFKWLANRIDSLKLAKERVSMIEDNSHVKPLTAEDVFPDAFASQIEVRDLNEVANMLDLAQENKLLVEVVLEFGRAMAAGIDVTEACSLALREWDI